ncbi:MAG: 2-aminoethylphosphonate--pyruvate transaminase [Rhodospirillales bacterium]|nr:2-aminoethylphosphonate--pyruvate transaminase [Rhodospirillales bacterium]
MPDPYLLTPGPLTTSATVKAAMLHDWGSRDAAFIAATASVRDRLVRLAGAEETHTCVLMQGSGTFVVEAMIGSLVPPSGTLLVLVNGAYGRRMVTIAERLGRAAAVLEWPEDKAVDAAAVATRLAGDPAISHVAVVQCETTSGLLNPLDDIAAVCAEQRRPLLIDAMSAFGALPLDARATPFMAVAASSNKCLEGVPGLGFAIVRCDALAAAAGNAPSLSLDLYDQWRGFEDNGQWRFTPPTHVLMALAQALDEHAAEGGTAGRGVRYRRNLDILVSGMAQLGFAPLLAPDLQAPIIVTFRMPTDPAFLFERFYAGLSQRGYVIYPGKLTVADSFRIGCIGRIGEAEMHGALAAIAEVMGELGVASGAPPRLEAAK